MSSNYFELLLTNQPTKKAAAPKAASPAAPKPAKKAAAPKAAAPKTAAPKAAAPAPAPIPVQKAVRETPKIKEAKQPKEAKFSIERLTKENTARQGDRKPRFRPASDFTWKEGDEPAIKSDKIGGNNRKERRAFENRVAEIANAPVQKRQFDRRSPHPVGEVKKGGFGKGNWGTPGTGTEEDRVERRERRERRERGERKPRQERAPKTEGGAEETKTEEPAAPRELTAEEIAEKEEKEREAKLLTLKQYKKKVNAEKVKIALPAPRAAADGDWSEFTVLSKEADSEKPSKKSPATPAASAAAPAAETKAEDSSAAHSQSQLKKKEAEKKILSQLLENNALVQKTAPRREQTKRQSSNKNAEFGLVVDEFPSLSTKASAVAAAATESQ